MKLEKVQQKHLFMELEKHQKWGREGVEPKGGPRWNLHGEQAGVQAGSAWPPEGLL